jgi:superfamily II DNA/RNA helicase
MQGKDMIGRARTGTGKTLAFGIPIMDRIIRHNDKHGLVPLSNSATLLIFLSEEGADRILL